MASCILYLRKNQQEPLFGTNFIDVINDMETTEEYICRIKKEKYTPLVGKDVAFHLEQLMEINVDCRLIYEWFCKEIYELKISFLSNIDTSEKLYDLLDFKKYHFTTSELKQFDATLLTNLEDDFQKNIECRHKDIVRINEICRYKFGEEKIIFNKGFLDSLVEQGLFCNLCIIPNINDPIKNFALNERGEKIPVIDFTSQTLKQYDKISRKVNFIYDLKTFYQNIANAALDDYIKIWYLLGKEDKRKNKTKMYETMTKEELLEVFHKKYKVQDNFFKLLQTKEYNGKITFDENYRLIGNNYLVISYLYDCAIGSSDNKLLSALFEKKRISSYVRIYKDNSLKEFKAFLKENEFF